MTRGHRAVDGVVAVLVLGIVYASIARRGEVDCSRFAAGLLRESLRPTGADLLGNVFAYLLLGAALGFAWLGRRPPGRIAPSAAIGAGAFATLACALLSFSMEAVQACLTERVSSAWDVFGNTAGGALGWFSARLAHPVWAAMLRGAPGRRREGRLAAVVMLGVLAWLVAQTAPWVPSGSTGAIRASLKGTWGALGGIVDPWRLVQSGAGWLALGLAVALPMRRPALAVLPFAALAALASGWRWMLPLGNGPSPEALLTLPAAALVVATLPWMGRRACAAVALIAATVAMVALQLEPGYGPTHAFRWRIALLAGDPINGIRQACQFGAFAVTVVAAGHLLDGRHAIWAVVAATILAATEWVQTSLPGRTPDLSPVFVALACGALAAGVLAAGRARRAG